MQSACLCELFPVPKERRCRWILALALRVANLREEESTLVNQHPAGPCKISHLFVMEPDAPTDESSTSSQSFASDWCSGSYSRIRHEDGVPVQIFPSVFMLQTRTVLL